MGDPIIWFGAHKTKDCPKGEMEADTTYVDRDKKQYPSIILPCAPHDRTRAGIRESGASHFAGEELQEGDPVVSRAVTVIDQNTEKSVCVPCVDLMVNFGSDKQGPVWKYVPSVRLRENVPQGPGVTRKPFYFDGYDHEASQAVNKGEAPAESNQTPVVNTPKKKKSKKDEVAE